MERLQTLSLKYLVTSYCLLLSTMAFAAATPSPAVCEAGLSWTTEEMDFGNYVGGTTGTITMDPAGVLTNVGVVSVAGGTVRPAKYVFTNSNPDCLKGMITITLPVDINIYDSGSTSTIIINNFVTSIAPNTKFKLTKTNTITIGGTLNATNTNTPDSYTGPLTVIFSY